MAGIQPDPNSVQGVLSKLLNEDNYNPAERQNMREWRDDSQAQALDTMRLPLADQGSVSRMVSDYLVRYGADPRKRSWDAAAQAIGSEGQRTTDMANAQLIRAQKADQEEVRMAENAVREADSFDKSLLGRGALGKMPSPEQLRTVYNGAMNSAAQVAKEMDFPDGEQRMTWIRAQADNAVKNYIEQFATQPTGPRGNEAPQGSMQPQAPLSQTQLEPNRVTVPVSQDEKGPLTANDRAKIVFDEFNAAKQQVENSRGQPESRMYQEGLRNMALARQELISSYGIDPVRQNLQLGQSGQGTGTTQPTASPPTQAEMAVPGKPSAPQAPANAPTGVPFKDKVQEAQKPEAGKALSKERVAMSELFSKNSGLVNNLSAMTALLENNPTMPEGELGPHIQNFRSGLKSLGIEVDAGTPDTQVFDALAKKLALGMKSADGQNLLPGAMSNYEDQLLQSMAPGLSGTREGNMKLMQMMIAVAQSNMRLAQKASEHTDKNGLLSSDWLKMKERYGKIETLRLRDAYNKIMGVKEDK
jgi:hypothetical protein